MTLTLFPPPTFQPELPQHKSVNQEINSLALSMASKYNR